ncbi:Fimbrial protein [Halioglobus japonicus]|nr:Fimbrial protein [Halioglobus japonicus]
MIQPKMLQRNDRHASGGFTLIEVMIVVVIVGVLLGIALPGYQNSMEKGRRSDARAALLDAANRQEQYMLDRGTYTDDMTDLGFGEDPYVSGDGHYNVAAAACDGGAITRCFELTATPRSGSPQVHDTRCTAFMLGSDGSKTASGSDEENCW